MMQNQTPRLLALLLAVDLFLFFFSVGRYMH
jgi:hypothetical protein